MLRAAEPQVGRALLTESFCREVALMEFHRVSALCTEGVTKVHAGLGLSVQGSRSPVPSKDPTPALGLGFRVKGSRSPMPSKDPAPALAAAECCRRRVHNH
jgi:hypothetical protein